MTDNIALIQGLLVMIRYNGIHGEVNPEHDQVYAGPEGEQARAISDDDVEALKHYNWSFDDDIERWYLD